MGVGNLQNALRDYGEDVIPYARLYFDSTPARHATAHRRIAALGDDSATYLWRVMAAREIMRLYRADPDELERIAALQTSKNSAEEVLHPADETHAVSTTPTTCAPPTTTAASSRCRGPSCSTRRARSTAAWACWPGASSSRRATYRALRQPALALLPTSAPREGDLRRPPLVVTSTVRDKDYQRVLAAPNREATPQLLAAHDGLRVRHPARVPHPRPGARLRVHARPPAARELISWVREPAAIHVTVSAEAERLAAVVSP